MNQVLLVSDQSMPNFLPILNAELKPDSVTLVVSDKMRCRAQWLKSEIAKHQVRINPDIEIGDDASDIASIQESLIGWADANQSLFRDSVLNVTGGTKPMAIAAQEVFRMDGRPVFYVDIATDRVFWLDKGKDGLTLSNQPNLNQLFGLNGITIESGSFRSVVEDERWRHFYREVSSNPSKWNDSIRMLNQIAFESSNRDKRCCDFNFRKFSDCPASWSQMCEMLHDDGLLRYVGKDFQEEFSSVGARDFCNGLWLEHYVFNVLKDFGFDKSHAMMNVQVVNSRGDKNEFDAVVLHGNTCYIIEAKTRNWRVRSSGFSTIDNVIYKLSTLSSRLGLRAAGVIVSAMNVDAKDRKRAEAYNLKVYDCLPQLKNNLNRLFGFQ